jgi:hypothetical protein
MPFHSWWQVLPAIPPDRSSAAYDRLRRVWFDHTWKDHPFLNEAHENHLTATLFENFVLFEPKLWVPQLLEAAQIDLSLGTVLKCTWGYEVLADGQGKLADVAIHARDAAGDVVVVIESKAKGGTLKPTDADPGSYLDLDEFSWCERRSLIYLVDEADEVRTRDLIKDQSARSGLLTWQSLGSLQIRLAGELEVEPTMASFVAGAIQYQYLRHRITPTTLSVPYLSKEPRAEEIHADAPDKMRSWETRWRLDI